MSSLPLAEEISAQLKASGIAIQTETGARPATLDDLRAVLTPLGLDLTTIDAEAWSTQYPEQARNITRICELEKQVTELTAIVQEQKEAAE